MHPAKIEKLPIPGSSVSHRHQRSIAIEKIPRDSQCSIEPPCTTHIMWHSTVVSLFFFGRPLQHEISGLGHVSSSRAAPHRTELLLSFTFLAALGLANHVNHFPCNLLTSNITRLGIQLKRFICIGYSFVWRVCIYIYIYIYIFFLGLFFPSITFCNFISLLESIYYQLSSVKFIELIRSKIFRIQ